LNFKGKQVYETYAYQNDQYIVDCFYSLAYEHSIGDSSICGLHLFSAKNLCIIPENIY